MFNEYCVCVFAVPGSMALVVVEVVAVVVVVEDSEPL